MKGRGFERGLMTPSPSPNSFIPSLEIPLSALKEEKINKNKKPM
jgi:hypothetical protein